MIKHCLVIAGFLAAVGCEKKHEPTAAEVRAAQAAQSEKTALEASKARADEAAKVANEKKDVVKDEMKAVDKKADDLADKADIDVKGLSKSDYVVKRAEDGSFIAWRKTEAVAGHPNTDIKDEDLVTQVKNRLSSDNDLKKHDIFVSSTDHIVTLKGTVDSEDQAGDAIRTTLGTPGAERVISFLTWK
jgi:osmotically-inducible protein OsmY